MRILPCRGCPTVPELATGFRIAEDSWKQYIAISAEFRAPMSLATLNDIFFAAVERNLERAQISREQGKWRSISSSQFARNVAAVANALQEWGIHQGDRVAILSENRPEWSTADFAILLLGAVTVPVYATLTPEQTAYTLQRLRRQRGFCFHGAATSQDPKYSFADADSENRRHGSCRDPERRGYKVRSHE